MAIHIWCPRASESAVRLRDLLHSQGVSCYKSTPRPTKKGLSRFLNRVRSHDIWVNWGPPYPQHLDKDIITLNWPGKHLNKMEQLIVLAKAGLPCPEVFDGPGTGRIGRSFKHQCASDLIHSTGRDYYTQKLPFIREVRVHIFQGKSIHTGLKVPRTETHHEWIRSYDTGWKLDYSRANDIKQDRRELAKKAIVALGLDFGAVDIGIVKDGSAAIIEVNTAPGLEGGTVEAYAIQLKKLAEGTKE